MIDKILNFYNKITINANLLINQSFIKYLIFLIANKFSVNNKKNIILFDNFESLKNTFFRSLYLTCFAKKFNAQLFFFNYRFNPIFYLIYKSIEARNLKIRLNKKQKKNVKKYLNEFFNTITDNRSIIDYELDGINIGIDIYESYLIRYLKPTIENKTKENKKLKKIVIEAFKIYFFWKDYVSINKENIKVVLLSHRNYIETNILNRISIKNNLKVITLSGEGHSVQRWKNLDLNLFSSYRKIFNQLDEKEQLNGVEWARNRINSRLSGVVGVDMSYSFKSAFRTDAINENFDNQIIDSPRKKILICSACFYDNPHCYGKMIFDDFMDIFKFLGKISNETNYDWYVKPHPDYLPGTIENLEKCKKFFSNLKILNPETSFHALKDKIDYAITPYGSVGHELPFLNIPVINCSNINPHQSYTFNFTPQNKNQLRNQIVNIENTKINKIDEIYEFYFIHYNFLNTSNLIDANVIQDLLKDNKFSEKETSFLNKKNLLGSIYSRLNEFIDQDQFKTCNQHTINILKKSGNSNFL